MLKKSRTLNEQFEAWKGTDKISRSWREYWEKKTSDTIKLYEKLGWELLCLGHDSKRPVKDVKWTVRNLEYEDAIHLMVEHKMNLAVNLKKSNLIVADIDDNTIPSGLIPFVNKTMSAITTSSHYHIYFNYDKDMDKEILNKLAVRLGYEKPELWRGCPNKAQYTVIPLSCVDKKYYEWLNTNRLMEISELI